MSNMNIELHTKEGRDAVFIADLEEIKKYLAGVFKIRTDDIFFRQKNLNNQLVLNAVDEERVKSFIGKAEYEELQRFYSNMSDKLIMFTIKAFRIEKGRIIATIDYKVNVELVTLSER